MDTRLVYYDESGDDGANTSSSKYFILTGIYMPVESWRQNFQTIKDFRTTLKKKYGFPLMMEMHAKLFANGKGEYARWSLKDRREIFNWFIEAIIHLDVLITNVIIDKTKIYSENYQVLENALKYSIQRIENDSHGNWKYLVFADAGRIDIMRRITRKIQVFNPIPSQLNSFEYRQDPIKHIVEDIIEKDSAESYFIQLSDVISFLVNHFYNVHMKENPFTGRCRRFFGATENIKILITRLKSMDKLNLKCSTSNEYGFVIYPK